MTTLCEPLDPIQSAVANLGPFLECQSRALGENGFQSLASSPLIASMLVTLATIFVALIGYRLLWGAMPGARDGVGWMVRLGIVLTLATSWPVFQTLFYRVATEGPDEVAALILPAAGISADQADARIEAAYDRIRRGTITNAGTSSQPMPDGAAGISSASSATQNGYPGMPITASLFVATTRGAVAAFHLATGLILALAPLGALCLLFEGAIGIFEGWLRALLGAVLGGLAATLSACLEVAAVETELAHQDFLGPAAVDLGAGDPQGVATVVCIFVPVLVALIYAVWRVSGTVRLARFPRIIAGGGTDRSALQGASIPPRDSGRIERTPAPSDRIPELARANAVAAALGSAIVRERTARRSLAGGMQIQSGSNSATDADGRAGGERLPLGVAARRSFGGRSRSAALRDLRP